jgi:uncharacterized protein (DUF1778 family)
VVQSRQEVKRKTASTRLKLRKSSLSGFIIKSSREAAEAVLAEQTRFVLPKERWLAFNAALDAPAKEIPALRLLLTEPSVFER